MGVAEIVEGDPREPRSGGQTVETLPDAVEMTWSQRIAAIGYHSCETTDFRNRAKSRKAMSFSGGTSRYVFTTDVSVNEGQAFIRDLVRVLGWFSLVDRCGR
jgi:hypothetical protein